GGTLTNTLTITELTVPTAMASTATLAANATSLIINGTGFSATPANDSVNFGSGVTGMVTAATATQLTVSSLNGLVAGQLVATVKVNGVSSSAAVQVATVTPVATISTTNLAPSATSLTINGFGFSTTPSEDSVTFGGATLGTVT